jgi:hypothetical protein
LFFDNGHLIPPTIEPTIETTMQVIQSRSRSILMGFDDGSFRSSRQPQGKARYQYYASRTGRTDVCFSGSKGIPVCGSPVLSRFQSFWRIFWLFRQSNAASWHLKRT